MLFLCFHIGSYNYHLLRNNRNIGRELNVEEVLDELCEREIFDSSSCSKYSTENSEIQHRKTVNIVE